METLLEDAEQKDEAKALIRSLIDKIVLTPKEVGGLDALLYGDLARILILCAEGTEEAKPIRAINVAGSRQAKTLEGQAIRGFSVSMLRGPETTDMHKERVRTYLLAELRSAIEPRLRVGHQTGQLRLNNWGQHTLTQDSLPQLGNSAVRRGEHRDGKALPNGGGSPRCGKVSQHKCIHIA